MPDGNAPSGLGISISVKSVRVPLCNASAIRVTLPGNWRSGSSGTRTIALTPRVTPNAASYGTYAHTRITSFCMISNMKVPVFALPCTREPTSTLRWVMMPSNGATTEALALFCRRTLSRRSCAATFACATLTAASSALT